MIDDDDEDEEEETHIQITGQYYYSEKRTAKE